jgi:hypothetical protein
MAEDRNDWADTLSAEHSSGWLTNFLAEEDEFDRPSLWRLGSWGIGAIAAVVVAVLANQSSIGLRQEQVAAADLLRQSQQIQLAAKEGRTETKRLSSAVDTLNSDRDRLYSRVAVLEQGLDSVTGSIARQKAVAATVISPPPPVPALAAESPQPVQKPAGPSLDAPPSTTTATTTIPKTKSPPLTVRRTRRMLRRRMPQSRRTLQQRRRRRLHCPQLRPIQPLQIHRLHVHP